MFLARGNVRITVSVEVEQLNQIKLYAPIGTADLDRLETVCSGVTADPEHARRRLRVFAGDDESLWLSMSMSATRTALPVPVRPGIGIVCGSQRGG